VFVGFGVMARVPALGIQWGWVVGLSVTMVALLVATGMLLWRTTRLN
jgi:hypothetical protein